MKPNFNIILIGQKISQSYVQQYQKLWLCFLKINDKFYCENEYQIASLVKDLNEI